MTNLRLPGQYDERLLGSLGLQGPYYNWNRWYLPSVGRYLELDPIAKAGGVNGFYGPNWYGYAEGNPLRWSDPSGRFVAGVGIGGGAILLTGGVEAYVYGVWDGKQCGILAVPALRAGLGLGGDVGLAGFWNWDADSLDDVEGFGVGLNLALLVVTANVQASDNTHHNSCEGSKTDEKGWLLGAGASAGLGMTGGVYLTPGYAFLWKVPCPSSWF